MAKRKADSFLYNCIWFVLIFSVLAAFFTKMAVIVAIASAFIVAVRIILSL